MYLGAAPGVGKTYSMLGEGHRRLKRGTDVVVGVMEDHGRAITRAMVEGLEVQPRLTLEYRGTTFTEMDVDGLLARRPAVALVDELAHTNVPGSRNAKRWEDVNELLDAGIDVVTTVNIQHLESLNDVVESITGVVQQETVPDHVVRRADQIELVDMSPEALRRRMAHGNVYPSERVDAALSHYFRVGNLTALRELALLWVADRVDEGLARYRAEQGIAETWPARERIVVALTGGGEGDTLIRRGARIAGRSAGRDLLAVHVVRGDGLNIGDQEALNRQRALTESLGGTFHTVVGDDVATALLEFSRGVNASQLVIGASRRGWLASALQPWTGDSIVRDSGDIDVHVVTHPGASRHLGRRRTRRALSRRRRVAGWSLALVGPWLLSWLLLSWPADVGLPTDLMLFLALTVAVALVGGLVPALVGAVVASTLLNYHFTPPTGGLTIAEPENAFALVVFLVVAAAVASVVDLAARRSGEAARAQSEAAALSALAGDVVRSDTGLVAVLNRVQEAFAQEYVALLERQGSNRAWRAVAEVGEGSLTEPEEADTAVLIDDVHSLVLRGRPLAASDRRVLDAFAAHLVALDERDRLRGQAAEAERLAGVDALRTSLLAAVSHDLRTPLAGVKAAVSSLRQPDVVWTPDERDELLATIEDSADRLDDLLGNLLDMSRLQTGALRPRQDSVDLADVVAGAARGLPTEHLQVDLPDDLPLVVSDAGLLERIVANVLQNAVRHSPDDSPVLVSGGYVGDQVELRIADRGTGVADAQKEQMFKPFQRLGDAPAGDGVGLGLAVARGFAMALGGQLDPEDTPGGGITMVLSLPASGGAPVAPSRVEAGR